MEQKTFAQTITESGLINHNLDSRDLIVAAYKVETGEDLMLDVKRVDANNISIEGGFNFPVRVLISKI